MADTTITNIPIPSVILKGDWCQIVYAIDTIFKSLEDHIEVVDKCVKEIIADFNNKSHYTVSLREVKRELVFDDECTEHRCTLVQFRIRDSY